MVFLIGVFIAAVYFIVQRLWLPGYPPLSLEDGRAIISIVLFCIGLVAIGRLIEISDRAYLRRKGWGGRV